MLLRVVAPHFVAGIVPGEIAAPIIQYMLRWPVSRIRAYVRMKRWTVEEIS